MKTPIRNGSCGGGGVLGMMELGASGGLAGGAGCAVHYPERHERGAKKAFQGGAKFFLMFGWAIWRPLTRF